MGGSTHPGKKKLLFEIKKRKVKNQKVVKNYCAYYMSNSPQFNQQSKSEVKEICIYQNMESGRHLSENK